MSLSMRRTRKTYENCDVSCITLYFILLGVALDAIDVHVVRKKLSYILLLIFRTTMKIS